MSENARLVPIFALSVQYTWDRYHSICSAIKCPLEIAADDYFVTSNSAVYGAVQAVYGDISFKSSYLHENFLL